MAGNNDDVPLFNLADINEPPRHLLDDNERTPFRAEESYHHATWAKTFHSYPSLIVRPRSLEEVQKTVLLARQARRRLVPVGIKHSPSDLTCTSSWMVDLTDMNRVIMTTQPRANGRARVLVEAGISLEHLNSELAKEDLTLPNLGSIDVQTLSGAISTATHGSSVSHGLLSSDVRGLRIVLADGCAQWCSAYEKPDLFRAALVSLGALGIITEIEFEVIPDRRLEWTQELVPMQRFEDLWGKDLWTQAEFVRCWWLPYLDRMVVWHASETSKPLCTPPASYYGGAVGYYTYKSLLWLARYIPSILPTVEWFVFGMQFGFRPGLIGSGVEPQRTALRLNCLYSQFVNEWALPLSKGPEAISRLRAWLRGDAETARIPLSPRGIYVHAPIEVRVSDGSATTTATRAFLDPTCEDEATLYLNATLYRSAGRAPPGMDTYYAAFEYLMRELGGKPHWAKNFSSVSAPEIHEMYGDNMLSYLKVRHSVDPDGLFVGAWHRRNLLGNNDTITNRNFERTFGTSKRNSSNFISQYSNFISQSQPYTAHHEYPTEKLELARLPFEEVETRRAINRSEGGLDWFGAQHDSPSPSLLAATHKDGDITPSLRSEESFDLPSRSSTEEITMSESVVRAGQSTVWIRNDGDEL